MKLYADIAKVEPQEDGTLKVWGYASSGAVDSDGETITPDAMKAAIPDYMKFGAVREMHGNSAAGTAIEASVDETGKTSFGAHVVDPIAVKKVTAGVYKGFSIGGKVTSRDGLNKSMITGLKLIEVSLVDRPANPEAVFTMYKAEKLEDAPSPDAVEKQSVSDIAELVNTGKILPSRILKAALEAIEADAAEPKPAPVAVEKAEDIDDLPKAEIEKKGMKWAAATSAAMADIHSKIKDCCDAMDAIGYKNTDGDAGGKADEPEITKADEPQPAAAAPEAPIEPTPAPAAADPQPLSKQEGADDLLKAELAKRDSLINDLAKRLATIEAQPMPTKAVLRTVTKANDIGTPDAETISKVAELAPDATPEQRALDGIKKAFQSGGRVIGANPG